MKKRKKPSYRQLEEELRDVRRIKDMYYKDYLTEKTLSNKLKDYRDEVWRHAINVLQNGEPKMNLAWLLDRTKRTLT